MKKTIWILPLLAVAAACNNAPANNIAANQTGGLPVPPDRAEAPPAPPQQGQQTAMPAGLDCVRNRLSPAQRQGVVAAAMEQAAREDPRAQALLQAVDACGEELSWSPDKRRFAGIFSMSAAGATGVRQELGGRGVRIQELDQVILGDAELMAAAGRGQLDGSVGQAFAARHRAEIERIAAGQPLEGELGTRIGNYIAFIALAQITSARFASAP
jgi:hypothetical protein